MNYKFWLVWVCVSIDIFCAGVVLWLPEGHSVGIGWNLETLNAVVSVLALVGFIILLRKGALNRREK